MDPLKVAEYRTVETKTIWRWQLWPYLRDGWDVVHKGFLRIRMDRCVG